MDVRRFYVMSPRGEQGPFSVEELNEELAAERIMPLQQVRTGMGTMIGTVREVLIAPEALWNTAESGYGLNAVAMSQRRTRMVSLVVLGLTLVPALSLILLLNGREENAREFASASTTPAAKPGPTPSVTLPPPPPALAAVPIPSTPSPPPRPAAATTTPAPAPRPAAATSSGVVQQEANGVLTLTASSAIITSKGARLQGKGGDNPHIGSWNNKDGGLEWQTIVTRPGQFHVVMTYACNRSGAGAILKLTAGGDFINDTLKDTGSWDVYTPHTLIQQLTIATAGALTISLSPQEKKSSAFMKLVGIVLTPADGPH